MCIRDSRGDTVTVGDVFDSLKGSSQTQQSVLSATLQKALEKEYGSKVSKEDVDKAYKQASEQYGDQFSQVLAAYGQTEESVSYTHLYWSQSPRCALDCSSVEVKQFGP